MKNKENREQVYSDTRTKELKEVLNKNRQINKNLDNYAVSNFWTQPYQDLGSKQAINLGINLVKESLYTGVGEAVLKVIPGLLKNIRASRLKNSVRTLEQSGIDITDPNIDLIRNQAKETIKYVTSPELRNQLIKLDQEFGTYYTEALDQYLDYYAKTGKLLKINYNPNYPQGGATIHNANNILDPSKQVINLGNQFRSSTVEHEFKHNLEYMEAAIRAKHNNLPLTNETILNSIKSNPRNKKLFYDNFKLPEEIIDDFKKKGIDLTNDQQFRHAYNYYLEPTELNSQFTPLMKHQRINNIDIETPEQMGRKLLKIRKEQDYHEPLDLFYNFIRDKMKFVKDWSKYKYLGLPINNENTKNE